MEQAVGVTEVRVVKVTGSWYGITANWGFHLGRRIQSDPGATGGDPGARNVHNSGPARSAATRKTGRDQGVCRGAAFSALHRPGS